MPQIPNNNQPLANQQQQQKPAQGTGFTNLRNVLAANRQNRLGSAVTQGVTNVAGAANKQLGQAKTEFNTGLQQSQQRLSKDQQTAKSALEEIGRNVDEMRGSQSGTQSVNTQVVGQPIAYDPNQPRPAGEPVAQQSGAQPQLQPQTYESQEEIDAFGRLAQGKYEGPQGLNQSEQLLRSASDAESLGKLAASREGRRGILQRFAGQGQYTQGQQRLDDLLLGQTAGNALNQARRDTRGILRNVNQATTNADLLANQQEALTNLAAQQVKGDIGSSINLNEEYLNKAQQDAISQNRGQYENIKNLLQSGQPLSDSDARFLEDIYSKGRDFRDSRFLGSKDFSDALKAFDESAINRQNVSSLDDVNRAIALQKYAAAAGRDYNAQLDAARAGTFSRLTGIDVNQAGLDTKKSYNQSEFERQINPVIEQGAAVTRDISERNAAIANQNRLLDLISKSGYDSSDFYNKDRALQKELGIDLSQSAMDRRAALERERRSNITKNLSDSEKEDFNRILSTLDSNKNATLGSLFSDYEASILPANQNVRVGDMAYNPGYEGYGTDKRVSEQRNTQLQQELSNRRNAQINALNQLRDTYSSGGLRGRDYGQSSINELFRGDVNQNISDISPLINRLYTNQSRLIKPQTGSVGSGTGGW